MTDRNTKKRDVQVKLPGNVPVLYSDSTFLTINDYGVVLDFAQRVGPTNQQNIVARIGMSKEHARILIERLSGLLVKSELERTQVTEGKVKGKAVN